jgi:hypothetical protein
MALASAVIIIVMMMVVVIMMVLIMVVFIMVVVMLVMIMVAMFPAVVMVMILIVATMLIVLITVIYINDIRFDIFNLLMITRCRMYASIGWQHTASEPEASTKHSCSLQLIYMHFHFCLSPHT